MSTQLLVPLGGSTEIEAENAEPRILRRRLAHLDREWETISKQYSYSVLRSQSLWGPASKSKVPRGWAAWGLGYAWVKTYVGDELIYPVMGHALVMAIGLLLLFLPNTIVVGVGIVFISASFGWPQLQMYREYKSAKRGYLERREQIQRRLDASE